MNEWTNERHLSCIGALQCVAECDLLPRFFSPWILALRNKHHVASSEMPLGTVYMCVGVRVVYFLLLLDSVLSRMFCANCVSAIIFNIQQKQSARTHKHTNTNKQQQLQSCQYWNFFFFYSSVRLAKHLNNISECIDVWDGGVQNSETESKNKNARMKEIKIVQYFGYWVRMNGQRTHIKSTRDNSKRHSHTHSQTDIDRNTERAIVSVTITRQPICKWKKKKKKTNEWSECV